MKKLILFTVIICTLVGCKDDSDGQTPSTPVPIQPSPTPTPVPTPPPTSSAGPISGYTWSTGHWVNGDNDENKNWEMWRGMKADSVTQSFKGRPTWYEHAGCESEAVCDQEFMQLPTAFTPSFKGIFQISEWKKHIWGVYPATEYRKKLIHLAWMDSIPSSISNGNNANPKLWLDIKNGAGDKYMYLFGRKFAYLDKQFGDTVYPMTFDLTYEWTLITHSPFPGGGYTDAQGNKHSTYEDFPYGWARLAKAFREGYKYQAGKDCPYRFSWRPQLSVNVRDIDGNLVRQPRMWPNDIADWVPGERIITGRTVIPAGPIGKQADLLCVSWHDTSLVKIKGKTLTETGSTWQQVLNGNNKFWGLQEAADFARSKGVKLCMPEWAPVRQQDPPVSYASTNPADVIRFTHYFMTQNKDILAYENMFSIGEGRINTPWVPAQSATEEPGTVYKQLWRK